MRPSGCCLIHPARHHIILETVEISVCEDPARSLSALQWLAPYAGDRFLLP